MLAFLTYDTLRTEDRRFALLLLDDKVVGELEENNLNSCVKFYTVKRRQFLFIGKRVGHKRTWITE